MRVFILTLGTRGDFQLFLTLGCALRRRGHQVILGASPFFSPRVRQAQLGWVPIGTGSLEGLVSILQSLASEPDAAKRTHRFYARWLQPQLSMSMSQITGAGARADYFISNLKMVLQRDGKIIPGAAVTYDPPGALEDLAKYGTQNHHGLILDLVAMSRRLVDPDGRWGAAYHFTGFWTDGPPADWTPSPDLQTFVSAGPPPVVVTMGSMVMFDAEAWVRDLLEALRLSGQRGSSWAAGRGSRAWTPRRCPRILPRRSRTPGSSRRPPASSTTAASARWRQSCAPASPRFSSRRSRPRSTSAGCSRGSTSRRAFLKLAACSRTGWRLPSTRP